MIVTIVGSQGINASIEPKPAFGDAVAITANDAAEMILVFDILVEVVVAEDHIVEFSGLIRRLEGDENAAKIGDARLDAVLVPQGIKIHRLAVRRFPKRCLTWYAHRMNLRIGVKGSI